MNLDCVQLTQTHWYPWTMVFRLLYKRLCTFKAKVILFFTKCVHSSLASTFLKCRLAVLGRKFGYCLVMFTSPNVFGKLIWGKMRWKLDLPGVNFETPTESWLHLKQSSCTYGMQWETNPINTCERFDPLDVEETAQAHKGWSFHGSLSHLSPPQTNVLGFAVPCMQSQKQESIQLIKLSWVVWDMWAQFISGKRMLKTTCWLGTVRHIHPFRPVPCNPRSCCTLNPRWPNQHSASQLPSWARQVIDKKGVLNIRFTSTS